MELKSLKPICFFDLETTGIDITEDRIVKIPTLEVYPNGNKESKAWLVGPTIPIPAMASTVHGITDKKIASEPTFKELTKQIHNMVKDSDLASYSSNRFDIPLLAEKMLRAGVDFDLGNRMTVDIQTIFHKMKQRISSTAYEFYYGRDLLEAHTAAADIDAACETLKAQLDEYDNLENNIKKLSKFTYRKQIIDLARFIGYNSEGEEIFTFKEHKGSKVEDILVDEPGYFGWLLNADFPLYTKKILTVIKLRRLSSTIK